MSFRLSKDGLIIESDSPDNDVVCKLGPPNLFGLTFPLDSEVVVDEPIWTFDYKEAVAPFALAPDVESLSLENTQLRNQNLRLEKERTDWKHERAMAERRHSELELENAQLRQQVLDLAHLRDMLQARWRWLVTLCSHPYPKRTLEDFGYSES